ncbi:MAG TPA: glycosyltransferase family 9 protein [Terriglobales bacterium]|nr:glycosyltransferase family 9 protein [Terriglobales bacterium]
MILESRPSGHLPRSLVLFPGALGDFICFLPTLSRMERSSNVDLFARTDFADLVPSRVRLRSFDCDEIRRLFVSGGADDERVKNLLARYDSVYTWMGSGVAEFTSQLSALTNGKAEFFSFRSPRPGVHQADYFLGCLGGPPQMAIPHIGVKQDAQRWADTYWRQQALVSRAVLAMAPGSGAREKNWPVPCFAEVAKWWRQRLEGTVMVILGPAEEERRGYDGLCRDSLPVRNFRLALLAAVLSRCDAYLGNDSGITHLAAAVGTPTLALFGPSDASQWAPRGTKVTTLTAGEECSPCAPSTMKSCCHRRCLTALEPLAVIRQLERMPAVASLTGKGAGITVRH